MKKIVHYGAGDRMCDLVENDYRVLMIMARLGLGLGVGDKTVGEVCADSGVDVETFLVLIRMMIGGDYPSDSDIDRVSLSTLIDGLTRAHSYYLDYRLPEIRKQLINAWGGSDDDLLRVMVNYYDEFVADVRRHASYGEEVFFPYALAIEQGKPAVRRRPDIINDRPDLMSGRLGEMRRLLVKYYPARDTNAMNTVLFDLAVSEQAMELHRNVENVLLPAKLARLERAKNEARNKARNEAKNGAK